MAVALMWRASVEGHERQRFQTSAANITGTLSTQLRRDTDFVRAIRALLDMQPNVSSSGLDRWFGLLEDTQIRRPGLGATFWIRIPQ